MSKGSLQDHSSHRSARWVRWCNPAVTALLLLAARPAAAQGYTVTDLGTLGGSHSKAYAINASGQVVGDAALPGDAVTHAFLWENGTMRDLDTLGSSSSEAVGINASGQVVGYFSVTGITNEHACLYDNTGMHDLGTFGSSSSIARGINDAGWIVGTANWSSGNGSYSFIDDGSGMRSPAGAWASSQSIAFAINASGQVVGQAAPPYRAAHAVRYDPSGIHDLGTLGGSDSAAYDINDAGQIVGYANLVPLGLALHAFLFDNQGMHDLGSLDGTDFSVATALNSGGQIVGYSHAAATSLLHAFLYDNGVMTDLNNLLAPGSAWTLTEALDINDYGQIIGVGLHNGLWRAFLLTPPAPPAPSGLTAVVVSGTQVFLSWTDNSGDETAFALWRQAGSGSFVRIGVLTPNTTAVLDSGVTAGTPYTYEIRAIGLGGASAWSNPITVTPSPPALSPPTFLTAIMMPRAQVRLSWTDNSTNETAFAVWRKTGSGAYTRVGVVPPNSTRFTDVGVSPSTLSTYEVRAINDTVASAWSNEISVLTPAQPGAPTGLTATASGQQISLTWTDNTHVATALEVYRKSAGGTYALATVLAPDSMSFTDTGLNPSTTYSYRVRAANDDFASGWSNEAAAQTGP